MDGEGAGELYFVNYGEVGRGQRGDLSKQRLTRLCTDSEKKFSDMIPYQKF